jgi:hypothetical protein
VAKKALSVLRQRKEDICVTKKCVTASGVWSMEFQCMHYANEWQYADDNGDIGENYHSRRVCSIENIGTFAKVKALINKWETLTR